MSDTEIIELDNPEPASTPRPWRAGSFTLVVAPLLVIVVIIALAIPRPPIRQAVDPEPTPGSISLLTTGPQPTTPIAASPVAVAPPESGDAELLETQHWTTFGPSYAARGDVAETVLNGYAYVIAGSGTLDDGRQVFRYDVHTGERDAVAELPISLDHAMAATVTDRVYVFGGFVFGRASARVFSLSANDATWKEEAPMPAGRAAGGAAVLGDRVWIVGGVGEDGSWIRDTWSYSVSGGWSSGLALLPTPRDHLAVGTYRGRVCAAGGNGANEAFECYDTVRNEWSWMPALRKPVIGGRAIEANGWFWVVANDVHVFTFDHWHFGPRLNNPRAGHALIEIDGALYVIEGGQAPANERMEMLRPQP